MRPGALLALGAALLAAAPAAAQSCVEAPLPPAGWLAQVRGLVAPETRTGFDGELQRPVAGGFEAMVARDLHGPTAVRLSAGSTAYDLPIWYYDPSTGESGTDTIDVDNVHLAARLSFDLYGRVPVCPFVEAGGFRAQSDGASTNTSGSFGGFYAGTGWTYQPRWRLDAGPEVTAFATARLLVIVASTLSWDGYEEGSEVLPKFGLRGGAAVAWRAFFVGADLGIIMPAADPDFWLRHNSADDDAGVSFGLRAGVVF